MDGGTLSRSGIVSQVESRAGGCLNWIARRPAGRMICRCARPPDLGEFGELSPLPWRYGRAVSGECVGFNAQGHALAMG